MTSSSLSQALALFGARRHDAKSAVVEVLAREWPLSAKQIHLRLANDQALSYQAVHKAVCELLEEGVVLKDVEGFVLSRKWLSGVSQQLSSIICAYDSRNYTIYSGDKSRVSAVFRAASLLKSLLTNGNMRLSRDEFFLYGHRCSMVAMRHYLYWYEEFKRSGKPNFMYKCSKKLGVHWFTRMREQGISRGNLEEEIQFGCDVLSIAGWGGVNIEFVDTVNKAAGVTMDYSPFASEFVSALGESRKPVDDLLRGCLAGGFSVIISEPSLECVEMQCIASGADKCVFEVKRRSEFDFKSPLVKAQLR